MKSRTVVLLSLITAVVFGMAAADRCIAQTIPDGLYFGQTPPGTTPEVFAPGIISLSDRYEYSIAFSPDLTECVFGLTNRMWNLFTLLITKMDQDSAWSNPDTASFLAGEDGLNPAYSQDGETIFFASSRPSYPPANLWRAERNGEGWTAPAMIPDPVSTTGADEFCPCLTATGVLYFVSYRAGGLGGGDVYRSVPVGGVYTSVENIGAPVNTASLDGTPYIAPDGSYLIFESDRPGGYGKHDLYISYRRNNAWSEPENLGPDINTNQIEDEPYVSPDGQFLFFNRRANFMTSQQTDLYWVDISAAVDPTAVNEDIAPDRQGSVLQQNVPNPFRPATKIAYTLVSPGFVTIQIYDVAGREVASLVNRQQGEGTHIAVLPASRTNEMASGPYFYRLVVNGEAVGTKKMLLVK